MSEHNFKIFEKVLVRDKVSDEWRPDFFSRYNVSDDACCVWNNKYVTISGDGWAHCIPFAGNGHLCFKVGEKEERDDQEVEKIKGIIECKYSSGYNVSELCEKLNMSDDEMKGYIQLLIDEDRLISGELWEKARKERMKEEDRAFKDAERVAMEATAARLRARDKVEKMEGNLEEAKREYVSARYVEEGAKRRLKEKSSYIVV